MSNPVAVGHGTTAVFGTSGYQMEKVTINHDGAEIEPIDVTHMESPSPGAGQIGGIEKIANALADAGEITIEGHMNPDSMPPLAGVEEQLTIQFPPTGGDTTGASWVMNGFVTSVSNVIPRGDKMMRTIVFTISGFLSVTAGSA